MLPAYYLHTFALSIVTLGLIEGLAESIVSLTKLFSGSLSDRTGRRPVWMFFGYGISAVSKPLLGVVGSGLGIALFRTSDRFGKGIRGAPRDALIAGAIDESQRGRAFGVQRALDHSGALVGGLVAAALLGTGLVLPRQLFLLTAIPGAISVLLIVLFVREPNSPRVTPTTDTTKRKPFSPIESWNNATPQLKRYLLPASVFALANASDMLLLAIAYERFQSAGYSEPAALAQLPLLWALLHVIKSLGSAWGGALSDTVDRVGLMRLAWVVYAGVYLIAAIMAWVGPAWLAWPMFALYGIYTIFAEAPEKALIVDLSPDPTTRGSAFGLVHFMTGILTLPATLIASGLWFTIGPQWAFAAGAVLALIAAAMLGTVRVPGQQP